MLMGFGIFNLVEGLVDLHLLGIHHVDATVLQSQWIYWDIGFLVWGALMLIGGWYLWKAGKEETAMRSAAMEQRRDMKLRLVTILLSIRL